MPRYHVTDPDSGTSVILEGDSPPTEDELTDIFSQVPKAKSTFLERQAPVKALEQSAVEGVGGLAKGAAVAAEMPVRTFTGTVGAALPGANIVRAVLPEPTAKDVKSIQDNPLYHWGQAVQEGAKEAYPLSATEEQGILTKVGASLGGFLPMMASGPAAPLAINLQTVGDSLESGYKDELAKGKSADEAAKSAVNKALLGGLVQSAIFEFLPKPLRKLGDAAIDKLSANILTRFLAKRVAGAATGAVLGGVSGGAAAAVEGKPILPAVAEGAAGLALGMGFSPYGRTVQEEALLGEPSPGAMDPRAQAWAASFGAGQPAETAIRRPQAVVRPTQLYVPPEPGPMQAILTPRQEELKPQIETLQRLIATETNPLAIRWLMQKLTMLRTEFEGEPSKEYATSLRSVGTGEETQLPRVETRQPVPEDRPEIRQETGRQADGGDSAQPGAEETAHPPDVAPEPKPAPVTFKGIQKGVPSKGIADIEQWNLTEDIPGHRAGGTVSRSELERLGFVVPESPKPATKEPEPSTKPPEGETKPPLTETPPVTPPVAEPVKPPVIGDVSTASKLRKLAEGLASQIEDKRRPMTQNPTPKRMKEYRSRLHDADNLERGRDALIALASAYESGTVPKELTGLKTKNDLLGLVYKGLEGGGYYDIIPSQKYARETPAAKALQALLEGHKAETPKERTEKEKASRISQLEAEVQFSKVPGFFPTPAPVIDQMLALADIREGDTVLEPSAGKGDIAEAVRENESTAKVTTVEQSPKLQQILKEKGFEVAGSDFMEHVGQYDRIVMNPPFENGQDAQHVRHAYDQLKPGGRLVSVMSEGPFFRSDRKSTEFREWFDSVGGTSEEVPADAFKSGFRPTGVKTRLVEITKPSPRESPLEKIDQQIEKVVTEEGPRSAKDVKSELVSRLEKAIEDAPNSADVEEKTAVKANGQTYISQPESRTKITIDIPGDGEFTVWNTKEVLTELLDKAKRVSTTKGTPSKGPSGKSKTTVEEDTEAASRAYGSPEAAYRSVKRQRDALQSQEPPPASEERKTWNDQIEKASYLMRELYGRTKAGVLESKIDSTRDRLSTYRSGAEGFEKEISRLESVKRKNPATTERLADLKERYAQNQEFIKTAERNIQEWEQEAAKEKAALESSETRQSLARAAVGTETDGWRKSEDGRWYKLQDGKPSGPPASARRSEQLESKSPVEGGISESEASKAVAKVAGSVPKNVTFIADASKDFSAQIIPFKGESNWILLNLSKLKSPSDVQNALREELIHGVWNDPGVSEARAQIEAMVTEPDIARQVAEGYSKGVAPEEAANQIVRDLYAKHSESGLFKRAVNQVVLAVKRLFGIDLTPEQAALHIVNQALKNRPGMVSSDARFALAPTKKSAADELKQASELTPRERTQVSADLEVQNHWASELATRTMPGVSDTGVLAKLNPLFGKRGEAAEASRSVLGDSPVKTFDQLMASSDIQPEAKQIVAGSLAKNILHFMDLATSKLSQAGIKIGEYEAKVKKLADNIDAEKMKRDSWHKIINQLVSQRQHRLTERLRAAESAGRVEEGSQARRSIEAIRASDVAIQRVITHMAETVSPEFLSNPNLTTPELLSEFERVNGGEQALIQKMADKGIGVSQSGLSTALEVMQASDQLASRVLEVRDITNPESVAALDQLAGQLKTAAKGGQWQELNKFAKTYGKAATPLELARNALKRLQPAITRAIAQRDQWMQVHNILTRVQTDADFKALQEKVFANFDIQSVVRTSDGYDLFFSDPISGQKVRIPSSLEGVRVAANTQAFKTLFDNAEAYVAGYDANPEDPKYDVRKVAAWRSLITNTKGFYLNPALNPTISHFVPWKFDLWAFLRDPLSVLRNVAGRESNTATARISAMDKVRRLLQQIEGDPGSGGGVVDGFTRAAANASKMTQREWQQDVGSQLLASVQRVGTAPLRIGHRTLSGHIVTQADWNAVRAQYSYLRKLRTVAEEAGGFGAAKTYPTRVISGGISRTAIPTGLMTVPTRLSARAAGWARDWSELGPADRAAWLNQEDNFQNVVMGHLQQTARPGYSVGTKFAPEYKEALGEYLKGEGPRSIDDLVQFIDERQSFKGDEANILTPSEIRAQILSEIGKVFENYESDRKESAKPQPNVFAVSAENSFTKPRSERSTVPDTFHDFGIADYADRIHYANDAAEWYSVAALESLKTLDAVLQRQMAKVKGKVESGELTKEGMHQAQLSGSEFYDYATLKRNSSRIRTILKAAETAWGMRRGSSAIERLFNRIQSFIGGEILLSPGARATHTFGMFGMSSAINSQLQNAVIAPQFKAWGRFFANGFKDVAALIPVKTSKLNAVVARNLQNPSIAGKVMNIWLEMVIHQREQHEALKELGILPRDDIRGAARDFSQDFTDIFKNRQGEPFLSRLQFAASSALDLHNEFLRAYSPVKYNDFLLNSDIRAQRMDIIKDLQAHALRYFNNRQELMVKTGWDDLTKPENALKPEEITGSKSSTAARQAASLRRLFVSTGSSLDAIMLRYYKAVAEAKAGGQDPSAVQFISDGEAASIDFQLAQERGLNSPGTRNLAAQGGTLRRSLGFIHGLPLYSMGRYLSLGNRLSTETPVRAIPATLAIGLPVAALATAYGLAKIQTTSALNRALFNQATANPTLGNAQTPDDYAKLLARSLANWFPIVGDIVNGAILKQPDRMGHLDSMFVMWGLVTDLANAAGDAIRTGNPGQSLLRLAQRWMPLQTKTINVVTGNKSGLRDHWNAVSAIQSALPPSMEARVAGGGIRATATTPIIYAAIDAMYRGDWNTFEQKHQEYLAEKGGDKAETSFKASIEAHNPWTTKLGRLPTAEERQQILSRMTDAQRADLEKSEAAFSTFGSMYGAKVDFTHQEPGSGKSASVPRGTSLPTVSLGRSRLPAVGVGRSIGPAGGGRRVSLGGGRSSGLRGGRRLRYVTGHLSAPRRRSIRSASPRSHHKRRLSLA